MEFRNVERVAIIGAGVAGLATAKTLLASGISCTIFERAERLGGVWADGYSNFGVQVQKELYEFPDWPLPDDTPNFTPGPIFQKYLEAYVDRFGVRPCLRLSAKVVGLRRRGVRGLDGRGRGERRQVPGRIRSGRDRDRSLFRNAEHPGISRTA